MVFRWEIASARSFPMKTEDELAEKKIDKNGCTVK